MAKAMRKMAVYLGLVEDDHRYQDLYAPHEDTDASYGDGEDYDQFEEYADYAPSRSSPPPDEPADEEPDEQEPLEDLFGTVFDLAGQIAANLGSAGVEARLRHVLQKAETPRAGIVTLYARTYSDARTIGEHFRQGTPVIINLTEMVDSDARRLVDFAAGLIFGLRGSVNRVADKVFLLSPANMEVTVEDEARIAERGFFNQS